MSVRTYWYSGQTRVYSHDDFVIRGVRINQLLILAQKNRVGGFTQADLDHFEKLMFEVIVPELEYPDGNYTEQNPHADELSY